MAITRQFRDLGLISGADLLAKEEPRCAGSAAGEATSASPARSRGGRPRIEDRGRTIEALKPWEAARMSRRTWYRRKAEEAKA